MRVILLAAFVVVAALSFRAWTARQTVERAARGTEDVIAIEGAKAAAAAVVRRRFQHG